MHKLCWEGLPHGTLQYFDAFSFQMMILMAVAISYSPGGLLQM
jgi:hypothetical protein